ncbi:hypothetical protein KJ966_09275 [bacterium]|nr:hypothetical protein [bacterium]
MIYFWSSKWVGALILCISYPGLGNAATENDDIQVLLKENAYLTAELELSARTVTYIVIDLKNNVIRVKAKGIVLRELPIEKIDFWGDPLPLNPLALEKKISSANPERIVVRAGEIASVESFKIDALELDDMPMQYSLSLSTNIIINIDPQIAGQLPSFSHFVSSTVSVLSRPLITLQNKLSGDSFTEIELILNDKDAQTLYWVFTEGMETIILTP